MSEKARNLLEDGHNELILSQVSSWEIQLKYQIGKLDLRCSPKELVEKGVHLHGINYFRLEDEAIWHLQKPQTPGRVARNGRWGIEETTLLMAVDTDVTCIKIQNNLCRSKSMTVDEKSDKKLIDFYRMLAIYCVLIASQSRFASQTRILLAKTLP